MEEKKTGCLGKIMKGCFIWMILNVLVAIIMSLIAIDDNPKSETKITQSQEGEEVISLEFEKNVIYDKKNVTISINGVEESTSYVEIDISVENNSKKDYGISAHSYAINGLMAGGTEYMTDVSVPAGKKGSFSISIDKDWLADNEISHIGRFDVVFWAYYDDFKEWNTDVIKIKTNMYDKEKMYKPNGEKIYSDDNMTVWNIGKSDNTYKFVVKNKLENVVGCTFDKASVNDWSYELTDYTYDLFDEEIHNKSYRTFEMEINNDFMEQNGIEAIENVEFKVHFDKTYWETIGEMWETESKVIRIEN